MRQTSRLGFAFVVSLVAVGSWGALGAAQDKAPLPEPYRWDRTWVPRLPDGRTWGSSAGADVDRDGHIWVAERCGGNALGCADNTLDPVLEFDTSGRLLKSFGGGMLVQPHGIHVDPDGNVWVTDVAATNGRGDQVFKFSPDGTLLMTLGKAGVAGNGPDTFNQPTDVVVAPGSGDIFVSDGHGGDSNARIVKFSKNGTFVKAWGHKGTGPGEFDTPHALAMDSQGRLFVADRANNRIQIFDQEGTFLAEWPQFSRPSGLFINRDDVLFAIDSETKNVPGYGYHPGWKRGIRIGSAKDGSVTAFIPDPEPDPDHQGSSGGEGVVEVGGAIYAFGDHRQSLPAQKKYVRR
jgi:DNA-binding beta-propeller fold protein YncE